MIDANYVLEPASAQYGDWVGTAAADEHQTTGHGNLDALVTLNGEDWWIVGIDITDDSEFYVYAIDRRATGIHNYADMEKYDIANGELPITSFLVHDMAPSRLLVLFTMFHIQVRHRSMDGRTLRVPQLSDLRYNEE